MKPYETNVSSPYGAPMGRRSDPITGRVYLRRVPFVDGDYDAGGAYWGGGPYTKPLYCAWNETGAAYVRASNRVEALKHFAAKGCSFFRGGES